MYYWVGVIFVWFAAGALLTRVILWTTLKVVADKKMLAAITVTLVERERERRRNKVQP